MQPPEILRIITALAVVLGLLGLAAYAARRFGLTAAGGAFVRRKRLALIETLPIDAKRRAAIIRCDNAEHLVVLNQNSATVIARNIGAPPIEKGDLSPDEVKETRVEAGEAFSRTFDAATPAAGEVEKAA